MLSLPEDKPQFNDRDKYHIPIALKAGFCSGTALGAAGALGAAFPAASPRASGGGVGFSDMAFTG